MIIVDSALCSGRFSVAIVGDAPLLNPLPDILSIFSIVAHKAHIFVIGYRFLENNTSIKGVDRESKIRVCSG
jgi:hypothetical protein